MSNPILWRHGDMKSTQIWVFKSAIEEKYNVRLSSYEDLRRWSITNLACFWSEVWDFTGMKASVPFTKVLENENVMYPPPPFFPDARLNFAENLLYPRCNPDPDSLAIIAATETSREQVTWRELRKRACVCTNVLIKLGVAPGDRIAGYLSNHTNALVAMLATTSIGAIWTAMSPDSGVHAVVDRLGQIEPKILFSDNAVIYNGKVHDVQGKVKEIARRLPTLQAVVVFETVESILFDIEDIKVPLGSPFMYRKLAAVVEDHDRVEFAQLPSNHPIYILYSSGTTGKPKCIVHGAVGTLIQHKKEHMIQCDIRPGDRLFYFTTCTWMMWHWLVSGLASGATLILYDGSPFRLHDSTEAGEMAMPKLIDELEITHFGTSAKYLSILEQKSTAPKQKYQMRSLKAIYSTGSPLSGSTFEYVYRAFGPNINLGSITGGTDIISLFGAPSQISPVVRGEVQVRGLGMAVEAWDFEGKDTTTAGEAGDLVCTKPFPCQPIYFWGEDGNAKYKKSYFDTFSGFWHHGDFIKINGETGGMIMLGRSDGVLKPAGVRFGSAEIYNVLLKHFVEVEDALCIGRRRETDTDETVVLFLKMAAGHKFSKDLSSKIQSTVKSELTARHVPAIIDECPEIPVTTNGKKIEVAVKQILSGMNVKTSASVANVECLDWYRQWSNVH